MYTVQETSIVQGPTCESCRHEWYLAFSMIPRVSVEAMALPGGTEVV